VAGRIGRHQHHWLGRRQHPLQQPGGFFQRVGAVADDDAGHLGTGQVARHRLRQPLPGGHVDVFAVELGDLLGLDRLGALDRQGRHGGQQIGHRPLRRDVADVVAGIGRGAGDGAARAQDDHRVVQIAWHLRLYG
jgi:hypothetical protein